MYIAINRNAAFGWDQSRSSISRPWIKRKPKLCLFCTWTFREWSETKPHAWMYTINIWCDASHTVDRRTQSVCLGAIKVCSRFRYSGTRNVQSCSKWLANLCNPSMSRRSTEKLHPRPPFFCIQKEVSIRATISSTRSTLPNNGHDVLNACGWDEAFEFNQCACMVILQ